MKAVARYCCWDSSLSLACCLTVMVVTLLIPFFVKYDPFDSRLISNGSAAVFNYVNCVLKVVNCGLCAVMLPLLSGVEAGDGFVQSL